MYRNLLNMIHSTECYSDLNVSVGSHWLLFNKRVGKKDLIAGETEEEVTKG